MTLSWVALWAAVRHMFVGSLVLIQIEPIFNTIRGTLHSLPSEIHLVSQNKPLCPLKGLIIGLWHLFIGSPVLISN